jgi:hypothetical protein
MLDNSEKYNWKRKNLIRIDKKRRKSDVTAPFSGNFWWAVLDSNQ